jgi:fatty acid desaturase
MEAHAAGLTVTRIPDPAEPVPAVAWPTVALLAGALALFAGSGILFLTGVLPWYASIWSSAIGCYLLFTVSHDSAHHSASNRAGLNTWIGRVSTPFFAPHASFAVWRFIHMQHHRFTNHDDGSDPDAFTMRGPAWQRPLRWLTIDLYYVVFYVPHLRSRPRSEQVEFAIQGTLLIALTVACAVTGHFVDLLLVLFIPARLSILWLAFAFDYLPHNGLHATPSEDKLRTTRNRVGFERIVSPLMLYQNYHLVHHLHPLVPFYRYLAVWRRNEGGYLAGDPALSTVRGRALTVEEYRRIRELAEH